MAIAGTVSFGSSTGGGLPVPNSGTGAVVTFATRFTQDPADFEIMLKGEFAVEVDRRASVGSYFRLFGDVLFHYPCTLGKTIAASLGISLEVGNLNIPEAVASATYYCEVEGYESPRLEADLDFPEKTTFVKGFELEYLHVHAEAYYKPKTVAVVAANSSAPAPLGGLTDDDLWTLAGSISGKVAVGAKSSVQVGAALHFFFDSRDNSWAAMTQIILRSPDFNATLTAAKQSFCKAKGSYLTGTASVRIGDDPRSFMIGAVGGRKRCGRRYHEKGAVNFILKVGLRKLDPGLKTTGFKNSTKKKGAFNLNLDFHFEDSYLKVPYGDFYAPGFQLHLTDVNVNITGIDRNATKVNDTARALGKTPEEVPPESIPAGAVGAG